VFDNKSPSNIDLGDSSPDTCGRGAWPRPGHVHGEEVETNDLIPNPNNLSPRFGKMLFHNSDF